MATDKKGNKSEKSSWSETRRSRNGDRVVVYSEISMTVNVFESNFIKITFGHERFSPTDSSRDLDRTEKVAYKFNEAVVERHGRKVIRLMRKIREAADE